MDGWHDLMMGMDFPRSMDFKLVPGSRIRVDSLGMDGMDLIVSYTPIA